MQSLLGEQMEYNPAVTLISFKNLHSLKSVSAFLSLAPKFGIWSPQLNWGVQKQWLDLETTDGLLKMNKPMLRGLLIIRLILITAGWLRWK